MFLSAFDSAVPKQETLVEKEISEPRSEADLLGEEIEEWKGQAVPDGNLA